jgi:hypothetical protein
VQDGTGKFSTVQDTAGHCRTMVSTLGNYLWYNISTSLWEIEWNAKEMEESTDFFIFKVQIFLHK